MGLRKISCKHSPTIFYCYLFLIRKSSLLSSYLYLKPFVSSIPNPSPRATPERQKVAARRSLNSPLCSWLPRSRSKAAGEGCVVALAARSYLYIYPRSLGGAPKDAWVSNLFSDQIFPQPCPSPVSHLHTCPITFYALYSTDLPRSFSLPSRLQPHNCVFVQSTFFVIRCSPSLTRVSL